VRRSKDISERGAEGKREDLEIFLRGVQREREKIWRYF
jgi:hypothetical protein